MVSATIRKTFAYEETKIEIAIPKDTAALSAEAAPLKAIELQPVEDPPTPPDNCHIIGLAYDLGPEGATFDPPLTITLEYDPASCPKGVAEEDLVIAYYDIETETWVEFEGCVVDTTNHTVSAQIAHLTMFAIVGEAAPSTPVSWSWTETATVILASIAVVALGLSIFLLVRRRRQAPAS